MEKNLNLNTLKDYKKILVIGCPGSGKSTLSDKLSKMLNLNLVHLDKIFWKPNWLNVTAKEFDEKLAIELKKDSWIIDGNYKRTLNTRISYCDLIIYLDLDSQTCLNSYYNRVKTKEISIKGYISEGCIEEIDEEFVNYIKDFNANHQKELYELVRASNKDYIIFHSRKEVENFINKKGEI